MRPLLHYTSLILFTFLFNNTAFTQTPERTFVRFTEKSLSLSDDKYYQQGLDQDEAGNPELAIGFYTLALRQNEAHHRARFNRGMDFYQTGKYAKAKEDFDKILERNPNDGEALELRGLVYYKMNLPKEAIADFNDAWRFTRKNEIYMHRGLAFIKMKAPYDAFQDFDRMLEAEPNNATAHSYKGETYASLGKYREAINLFNDAIELDPYDAYFYNNRGSAYAKIGKFDLAMEDFNTAISIEPLAQVFINRALCLLEQGDYYAAKQDAKTAMLLDSENADAYYTIGLTELEAGTYEDAISSFDVALELNPDIAAYHLERGKAWYFEGQYYKAIDDFYKVQKLQPNNEEIDEFIQNTYKALDKRNLHWMKENNLAVPEHDLDQQSSDEAPLFYQHNSPKTASKNELTEKGFKEDPFEN